jgi:hypothetical protein
MHKIKHSKRRRKIDVSKGRRARALALALFLVAICSAVILAGHGIAGRAASASAGPGAPGAPTSGVNLVKQYVYAGGRLVATKEP